MAKEQVRQMLAGETHKVLYTCWKKLDPEENRTVYSGGSRSTREPLNPVAVRVRLYDFLGSADVPLDILTDDAAATITGNKAEYLIPADKLVEGSYKVYTTFAFADGQVITEVRSLQVSVE